MVNFIYVYILAFFILFLFSLYSYVILRFGSYFAPLQVAFTDYSFIFFIIFYHIYIFYYRFSHEFIASLYFSHLYRRDCLSILLQQFRRQHFFFIVFLVFFSPVFFYYNFSLHSQFRFIFRALANHHSLTLHLPAFFFYHPFFSPMFFHYNCFLFIPSSGLHPGRALPKHRSLTLLLSAFSIRFVAARWPFQT